MSTSGREGGSGKEGGTCREGGTGREGGREGVSASQICLTSLKCTV